MNNFEEYKERKIEEYGEKFNISDLAKQFIPYYESNEKIKVKFSYGEIKTGRVGITTGWKPVFLLMIRDNSIGSSDTLGKKDKIVGIGKLKKSWTYKNL